MKINSVYKKLILKDVNYIMEQSIRLESWNFTPSPPVVRQFINDNWVNLDMQFIKDELRRFYKC